LYLREISAILTRRTFIVPDMVFIQCFLLFSPLDMTCKQSENCYYYYFIIIIIITIIIIVIVNIIMSLLLLFLCSIQVLLF